MRNLDYNTNQASTADGDKRTPLQGAVSIEQSRLRRENPECLACLEKPYSALVRFSVYHRASITGGQNRHFPSKRSNPQDATCRYITTQTGWAHQGRNISAMNACHLRVYYGPQEENVKNDAANAQRESVTVPLMEVMPLLTDALQSQRTWLRDFADDEVTISMDLYEVLLAYQHYRRPSA
jgi:hypothetical protein